MSEAQGKNMRYIIIFVIYLALSGCASLNEALTASLEVKNDPFDDSLSLYQAPVSSSGVDEDWHTLGFEWKDTTPEVIYITVGSQGVVNVSDVQFKVGEEIITSATEASVTTKYGSFSTRRFKMPINDFVTLATAPLVKMKVVYIDTYTVSSFGESAGTMRTVDQKFKPFVDELKARGVI